MGDRSDKDAGGNNTEGKRSNGLGFRFANSHVKYKESERTKAITAWA